MSKNSNDLRTNNWSVVCNKKSCYYFNSPQRKKQLVVSCRFGSVLLTINRQPPLEPRTPPESIKSSQRQGCFSRGLILGGAGFRCWSSPVVGGRHGNWNLRFWGISTFVGFPHPRSLPLWIPTFWPRFCLMFSPSFLFGSGAKKLRCCWNLSWVCFFPGVGKKAASQKWGQASCS